MKIIFRIRRNGDGPPVIGMFEQPPLLRAIEGGGESTAVRPMREAEVQLAAGAGPHPSIVCPICGYEYVDLGHPRSDGGTTFPAECEAGHRFEVALRFHKGKTYLSARVPRFTVVEGGISGT